MAGIPSANRRYCQGNGRRLPLHRLCRIAGLGNHRGLPLREVCHCRMPYTDSNHLRLHVIGTWQCRVRYGNAIIGSASSAMMPNCGPCAAISATIHYARMYGRGIHRCLNSDLVANNSRGDRPVALIQSPCNTYRPQTRRWRVMHPNY